MSFHLGKAAPGRTARGPKNRSRDSPVNPAGDSVHGLNKSWESPEVGGLGVGLRNMQGDTRGEYSAIIPKPVRLVMERRKVRVHMSS